MVQCVWWYLDIVKVERAGGGRAQAELVLLLADLKPLRVPVHDEAGDASVSLSIKREFGVFLHSYITDAHIPVKYHLCQPGVNFMKADMKRSFRGLLLVMLPFYIFNGI